MSKRAYIFSILFVFIFFAVCFAGEREDIPVLFTEVNTETVEFGGRVNVEVFTDDADGFDVAFPEDPEYLGDFSFISSYPIKAGSVKGRGSGRGYTMGVYSTGTHVIPSIKIPFKKTGAPDLYHVYSQQIPIEVTSLLKGGDSDIKEIKGLVSFSENLMTLFIVLGVILLVSVIVGVVFWWRKKQKKILAKKKVLAPHEIAYQELSSLRAKNFQEKGRVKEFYTILSDILRYYIEGRFRYHAPEMTTQEFIAKMKASPRLRVEDKKRLKDFLTHCDMIKFAKDSSTQLEMLDSFKDVETFVDQTRIVITREEGE